MPQVARAFGEYVIAMLTNWVSLMSGIASIVAALLANYLDLSKSGKAVFWIAAAVCFTIASFNVWHKTRPALYLSIKRVFLDAGITPDEESGAYLTITVLERNTSPSVNSLLDEFRLSVRTKSQEYAGRYVPSDRVVLNDGDGLHGFVDLRQFANAMLCQGQPREGWIRFALDGCSLSDLKGNPFELSMVDAYNKSYCLKGQCPINAAQNLVPNNYAQIQHEKRRDGLAALSLRGFELLRTCMMHYPVKKKTRDAVDIWEDEVATQIEANFGIAQKALFLSDAEMKSCLGEPTSEGQRKITDRIHTRKARLDEYIRQFTPP